MATRVASNPVDVAEAIDALPWVQQLCPFMPHQYAALDRSPQWAWFALDAMIADSPASYLAYFRGYHSPFLYWDGPDGWRYWRTRSVLNRCDPASVEPLPIVADGAAPAPNWDGAPWAANGSGLYEQSPDGKWWPTATFFDLGYVPCRACRRPPAASSGSVGHDASRR
jgi:hypothetical protein